MTEKKDESKLEASSSHDVTKSTQLVPDADSQSTYMQPADQLDEQDDLEQLGAYRIERLLGKGGMGNVYLGLDQGLERHSAIKVIADHLAYSQEAQERLATEARAAARLNHPNIVQVYAYGEDNGKTFIAFEYIKGRDLNEIIKEEGPLHLKRTLEVIKQAAKGLRFAYSQNVIHRDIKPANFMVLEDGSIKVADFGLAKELDKDYIKTRTDTIVGSPAYMSPEQGMGRTLDFRSDIYSLGATMFCCLTGRVPFHGETALSVLLMHANEDLPEPPEITKHLQGAVMLVVKRMMAKKPEDRQQSYDDLIKEIEELEKAFTTGKSVKAHLRPGDKLSSPLSPKQQKSNKALIVAGAIGVIMTGIVVLTVMSGGNSSRLSTSSRTPSPPSTTPSVIQPASTADPIESSEIQQSTFNNLTENNSVATLGGEQSELDQLANTQSLFAYLLKTERSIFGLLERNVPLQIRPATYNGNVTISKMLPGSAEIILPDGTVQTGGPPQLPNPIKLEIAKVLSEKTPNMSSEDRAKIEFYRFMLGDHRVSESEILSKITIPELKANYINWFEVAPAAQKRINSNGLTPTPANRRNQLPRPNNRNRP